MTVRVLIATPIDSLGQLIQQTLQNDGHYQADLVDSDDQALARAQSKRFDVAILDYDIASDFVDFVADLLGASPDIAVVALPPDDGAQHDDVDDVVDAWVPLPFYLPDLLAVLERVVGQPADEKASHKDMQQQAEKAQQHVRDEQQAELFLDEMGPERNSHPAPAWLQDVNRVAQHLTRLSLESAAPAALITRGSQLWAYAGQLPQLAADELARLVNRYWMRNDSDLARFVQLETTGNEYMLYATALGEDYVLALAFETEMSFMEMRSQAGDLARKLSTPPPQDEQDSLEQDSEPEALPVPKEDALPAIPADWEPTPRGGGERGDDFLDILLEADQPPAAESGPVAEAVGESQPSEVAVEQEQPQAGARAPQAEAPSEVESDAPVEARPEQLAETRPTKKKQQKSKVLARHHLTTDSATLHNLTYACVLVPRMPDHHLVGRIVKRIKEWMHRLSLAFGWRLEHISVRPGYLHWIAVVPPDTSPGVMVDQIQRETSSRIFYEYPRLKRENPSGEFWVSDYLVVNGRDEFSHNLIEEFIRNARSRQGAL